MFGYVKLGAGRSGGCSDTSVTFPPFAIFIHAPVDDKENEDSGGMEQQIPNPCMAGRHEHLQKLEDPGQESRRCKRSRHGDFESAFCKAGWKT